MLRITAGGLDFVARLEEEAAPETVAAFRGLLPLESRIIHVRWSGEGGWIPWGDLDLGLGPENATRYPSPGELIIFPGGISEAELLLGEQRSRTIPAGGVVTNCRGSAARVAIVCSSHQVNNFPSCRCAIWPYLSGRRFELPLRISGRDADEVFTWESP